MKKIKLIVTENQFNKLFSDKNYSFFINESSKPIDLLTNVIAGIRSNERRISRISDDIKVAFNLGRRNTNVQGLLDSLEEISRSNGKLDNLQIKALYKNFKNISYIKENFEAFFTKNIEIQELLRAYRKAVKRNNTRDINYFKQELNKFMDDSDINDMVSKLPDEGMLRVVGSTEFIPYKNKIRRMLTKNKDIDAARAEVGSDILKNKDNYNFTPEQWDEINNLIGLKKPTTNEFINLVSKYEPKKDGDFLGYLEDLGFITKDNYETTLKLYGAKTVNGIGNAIVNIFKSMKDNPIKTVILGILGAGLITVAFNIKNTIDLLSKWGFIKAEAFVGESEDYIKSEVDKYLNDPDSKLSDGTKISTINDDVVGQEITVVNASKGYITLTPGLYVDVNKTELVNNFTWNGEKLAPSKKSMPPKPTEVKPVEDIKKEIENFTVKIKDILINKDRIPKDVVDKFIYNYSPSEQLYTVTDPADKEVYKYKKENDTFKPIKD